MVVLKIVFVLLLAFTAFITVSYGKKISPRMLNGIPVDTMKRYSYHVTIQSLGINSEKLQMSGGSIINSQWVLTSSSAIIEDSHRIQIDFQKLFTNSSVGSYSAVVNNDESSVIKHPFFDIALIKVFFNIIFSDTVKPIKLFSRSPAQMMNKVAVLPGFDVKGGSDDRPSQLTYAMLSIVPHKVCKETYPNDYDEFLDICAISKKPKASPCNVELGSGLVVGWPANPELIAIYSSKSTDCGNSASYVFTNVAAFKGWIDSEVGEIPTWETTTTTTTMTPS